MSGDLPLCVSNIWTLKQQMIDKKKKDQHPYLQRKSIFSTIL